MAGYPFAFVALPEGRRVPKPRSKGRTMMVDFGIANPQLAGILDMAGEYLDFGKIAVGMSRLYREDYYLQKIDLYRQHQVAPFLGGQFLEYVFAHQGWAGVPPYLEECRRLGIEAIEVSDNCIPLSDDERARMTTMAVDSGLHVHGEIGSKDVKQSAGDLLRQAEVALGAGADILLVEAAELVDQRGEIDEDLIQALSEGLDLDNVLFELPGYWIKGVVESQVFELMKLLIERFGLDVSIANVQPHMVLQLEALRCGLGVAGPKERILR